MSEGIYPHPQCMAPDGADPCEGYRAALIRITVLQHNADRYLEQLDAAMVVNNELNKANEALKQQLAERDEPCVWKMVGEYIYERHSKKYQFFQVPEGFCPECGHTIQIEEVEK